MVDKKLLEDAIAKMRVCQDNDDRESAHIHADSILCDVLRQIGYGPLVEEYVQVHKWFA